MYMNIKIMTKISGNENSPSSFMILVNYNNHAKTR